MALNNTYFESTGRDVTLPIPEQPSYVPPIVPTPVTPEPGSEPVIPRPSFSGNVECKIYINACEKSMINKDNFLDELLDTTVTIKDVTSVVTPEIIIDSNVDLRNANYMKLGNYYYYIHPEMLPGGTRYSIKGVRDALTSFKNDILNLDVIVDKNEYDINPYLDDGSYIVEERQKIETIPFSLGFNDTGSHILITAGGA